MPGRQSRPYGLRSVVQKAGPVLNGRDDTTLDVLALLRIGVAMGAFEDLHRKRITGSLAMLTA